MSELLNILRAEISSDKHHWLITQIEPFLLKFQRDVHHFPNSSSINALSTIPDLLGIGEGSTPQSDDIFLGMIGTIMCKERSIAQYLSKFSTVKYENYTTNNSASLIRSFLRENYPKEIKIFMNLLTSETFTSSHIKKLKSEIRKIKMIGASSGYFFLVGVLWQLEYYENQKQNLIINNKATQN